MCQVIDMGNDGTIWSLHSEKVENCGNSRFIRLCMHNVPSMEWGMRKEKRNPVEPVGTP
jgi:hypothetical protein